MKKILFYWLLLLAFCLPVASNAQNAVEVIVGDSTSSFSYLPSYSFYNYSLTQQIYTDVEIGMPGTIESIAFFNTGTSQTRTYDVYMVETTKDQFNSTTDWITVSASDLVFSGSVTMTPGTWTVLDLNTPFVYSGASNLAVIVDDNTGSWSSGMTCAAYDAPGMGIYKYSDDTNYNPFTPSSYTASAVTNVKNRIKLSIIPSGEVTCFRPASMTLDDVDQTSASISWVPFAGTDTWQVFCGTEDDDIELASWTTTTDTFYTFSNLNPNVVYTAYVRTACTGGDVSAPRSIRFRTPQTPSSLPYSCDFTNDAENSQWLMTQSGVNHFVIGDGTSYDEGTDMSMYISNDDLDTYAATAEASYIFAERIIDFGETPVTINISLDWKASGNINGTSMNSALIVYLRDADEATPTGFPSYVNNYLQYSISNSDWTHQDIQVDEVSGLKKIQFFTWGYDQGTATQVPAAIDNLSIVEASCITPEFTVVPDAFSATVSWDGDPSGTYLVIYRPQGTSATENVYEQVVGDSIVITELTPATNYYIWVAQLCGNDTSVTGFAHTFTTECATITVTDDHAFVESFDGITSGIPYCWDNSEGSTTSDSYKWNYYNPGESGAGLRFNSYSNSSGNTNFLKTPVLDLSQTTDPQVTFSYKNPTGGDFSVYLSTDGGLTYTTALGTGLTGTSVWTNVTYPLSNLSDASEVVIVFKGTSNYGSGDAYIYLDNVIVGATPSCPTPTNITATSTSTDTIILSWTDADGDLWDIIYGPSGFDIESSEVATTITGVTDNPYPVSELSGGVMYDFYVRRDCGGGEVSPWSAFPASASPFTITMGVTGSRTVTGCGMTITDDGGPNGTYSNNCNYTLTILPNDADSIITISGIFAGEGSIDYLKIYDGTSANEDNLLAHIYSSMNGGSSGSQISFGPITSETGPLTLLFHSDGSVVYPGFVATSSCVPAPTCMKPTNLTVADIDIDAATITWDENESSVGYNVVISTSANFDPDTCQDVLFTNTNEYEFLDLNNNTNYYVYVQTDCGGDLSAWSNIINFLTLAGAPAETPYFCDFSDEEENSGWVLINGTQTNKWYIGTPTNETDTVLFISSNGTTESYTVGSASNVWAYRDIHFSEAAEFEIDVKWKAYGESCCDYLKVYLGPTGTVTAGSATAPTNAVALSDNLNVQSNYQHLTYALDGSYANTTKRLYFLWHNDTSLGSDPAAVIDEITITATECGRPYDLTVESLGSSNADISFNAAMETDGEWDYALCVGNEQPDTAAVTGQVTDTLISFSDLTPATTYNLYVRTVCGSDGYSAWSTPVTFTTACVFAELPIEENFDSYTSTGNSSFPLCWSRSNTYSTSAYPYITSSYAASGSKSLYFYASSTTYNLAVLPSFDVTLNPINTLQISFMLRSGYLTNGIIVGVMANPEAPNTFVPVDTLYPSVINQFDYLQANFSSYEGSYEYVALKSINGTSAVMYLDDVVLETIPDCPRPTHLSVTNVTENSVTLGWTENGSASNWVIEYGPQGFTPGSGTEVQVSTNPYTVDNLASAVTYSFYVKADCGGGDESPLAGPVSATPGSYIMPASGTNTITTCAMVIFDDGGINQDYSTNCNSTLIIQPSLPGNVISISGTVNVESGWDYLYVYDGAGTDGTLLGTYSGSYTITDLTSTTGPLTLMFTSDGTVVYPGFELTVTCLSNTCPPPSSIEVSNVGNTSADVSWTPAGSETSWIVEYKTADASTWTIATATTTSYQLIGLTGLTTYNVRVKADCGDETSSYKATSFTTPNCAATDACSYTLVLGDGYGDGWNNAYLTVEQNGFVLATMEAEDYDLDETQTYDTVEVVLCDNNSIDLVWHSGDYDAEASITLIGPDGTVIFTHDSMSTYTTYTFTTDCSGSGPVITNPTVATNAATGIGQTAATLNATITNPSSVTISAKGFEWKTTTGGTYTQIAGTGTGNTFTADLTTLTPGTSYTFKAFITYNGTTTYGQEMTFTTQQQGQPTEPSATTADATNVTYNSATLNGSVANPDNVTITAQGFQWKVSTASTYTTVNATGATMTYNLTGLDASTGYTFRAFVTTANGTQYGLEKTFTTGSAPVEPCDVPTGLTVTDVQSESITVTWDNANVLRWNLQYGPVGGTLASATAYANTYMFTNLNPLTTYQIQVQAVCEEGNVSDWSPAVEATTTNLNSYLENNVTLYPNPAKEFVDVRIDGDLNVTGMEVYDVYGKLINTVNVIDNTTHINVSGLANGMYFVRVTTEQGVVTKRFVKK